MSVFQNIVNQLEATDIKLDDELQVLLLLSSLSGNYEVLIVTLTNSSSNKKLVMSTVKYNMLNEEVIRNECGLVVTPNQSKALVTKSMGKIKTINLHNHEKSDSRDKSRTRKEIVCYNCGKAGKR